jgi:hypothetical protein
MAKKNTSFLTSVANTITKYSSATTFFSKFQPVFLYGFIPAVIVVGMSIEPKPSWWDLINIID